MSIRPFSLMLTMLLAGIGRVQAQSLGEEVILSRLGDPVEVEIEVKDWESIDLGRVEVVNATLQQYEVFGLVYQPLLDTLSFNVVGPNLAGEVKILVSSREPVQEPFLDLLLSLRWPDGSALREYVLLFDPPGSDPQLSPAPATNPAPALAVSDPMPAVQAPEPAPVSQTAAAVVSTPPASPQDPPPAEPRRAPEVREQPPAEVAVAPIPPNRARPREEAGRGEYHVRDGDTLFTIARQFQPAGIAENLYQFVLSLHAINPDAFIDGNISLLKADAELQIPSARDLAAINPASAQTVFDQRWLDATRAVQLQPEPEQPPPLVSPIEKPPVQDSVEHAVDRPKEPELPVGAELPDMADKAPLVAPSNLIVLTPVAPEDGANPLTATDVEEPAAVPAEAEVPAIQVVTQQRAAPLPEQEGEPAQANAALRGITDQAEAIRDLLQTRQQRLAAVEQQIQTLRNQLQRAEDHADNLLQELPQSADVTRQAVMLGLLAAVLLIALAATVMTALRWNRELQAKTVKTAVKSRRR